MAGEKGAGGRGGSGRSGASAVTVARGRAVRAVRAAGRSQLTAAEARPGRGRGRWPRRGSRRAPAPAAMGRAPGLSEVTPALGADLFICQVVGKADPRSQQEYRSQRSFRGILIAN